jgi:hypothetical protein
VVREAPPTAGGGLRYLGRDLGGRAVWTPDPHAAERHPSLREASRAALTAPPLPGALRPAYAVPVSAAEPERSEPPPRPALKLVVSDGEPVAETAGSPAEPPPPSPEWPPNPAAWLWMAWAPWIEAWRALMCRSESRPRG